MVYDPEVACFRFDGSWQRQTTLGIFLALTTQVTPSVFIGAEARYLRQYQGLDLGPFGGEALFIGPTTFIRLSKALAISGAWNFQVAGRAAAVPGTLDLTNFERQQALLRLEYNFGFGSTDLPVTTLGWGVKTVTVRIHRGSRNTA